MVIHNSCDLLTRYRHRRNEKDNSQVNNEIQVNFGRIF